MRIVLAGGSGQIGSILRRAFASPRNEVVLLSRSTQNKDVLSARWDGKTLGGWSCELDGADVVINLSGRSVNCRYTADNRRQILESRVDSTRAIGQAIAAATRPPRLWLQASTATIYAHTFGAPHDEASGVVGGAEADAPVAWRFSVDVARAWEQATREVELPQTRIVLLRSSMVMSPDAGGIFDVLLGLVRKGLGGASGGGRQFVSWIHDRDFVRAIKWLITHDELQGPVNLTSPQPLPNREFMHELREAWGIRVGLPATQWMLALGAVVMRTETELVMKSRRVVPGRLLESGFLFEFPSWRAAAADLCQRWRVKADVKTDHPRP